ncbi:MAG: hypothetical protein B7C54_11460 [Acidimicrobiales bacterium mtb01]|nr:CocE/NonD family hydrolase [Actinomycetota bacterium]TEX45664.1 MAG: hypothetical protein B7C54_11460 [Acidimicrobiales bacterium mtb01]
MKSSRTSSIALSFVLLVTAACGGGDSATPTTAPESTTTTATKAAVDFAVAPGTHQITITGGRAGTEVVVVDSSGTEVARGAIDELGSLLFRRITEGDYTVELADGSAASDVVSVYGPDAVPEQSFYSGQKIGSGFGYLLTRDGTTLSINVMLPGPAENGPYPTVVEYSGYAPSDPSNTTFGLLFNTLGYAYVGVNMRGTGCSGGSYRFFEEAQLLDGYDAIEAIAAQGWVLDNEVGMVGISYPGISQLFVASTQPPSLVAITPLSVLDDSYRSTLYPGGILNTGFAVEWTRERVKEAAPYGQEWTKKRADEGDALCAANQNLRLQNPDLEAEIDANPFYSADIGDEINPSLIVGDIDVPVFVAGAWQDEQTGGRFPRLLDKFTSSPHVYATLLNGLHTESLSPSVFPRLAEFLSFYVAKKIPDLSALPVIAGPLAGGIFGAEAAIDSTNRFAGLAFADALAEFEAEDPIVVLFEQGAADGTTPRSPQARWSASFDAWPIPEARMTPFALGSDGLIGGDAATVTGSTDYVADPKAVPPTFYTGSGSGIWRADVAFDWVANPAGTAAVFTTAPLPNDLVVVGAGTAALWIEVTGADDTDIEVTISEVRPDGSETYVQSGWLRASHLSSNDAEGLDRLPEHSHLESDRSPFVAGESRLVRVELFPVAHPFRKGSRLRMTVDAPGGNRGVWSFRTISSGEKVTIRHDADHPSTLYLPIVDGLAVPAGVAACNSLRGQPCRPA